MSSSEGTCPLQEPLCSGEEGLVVGHQTSYHSADPDPEAQISDAQSTPLTPLATSLNGNVPHTDDDEVEANGDGTKKKRVKLKGKSLRDLTTNQRNLLIALCILYFALYMLLSLIGPFFPIEAAKKGQTPFETGVVISMSWIVMFFMAPLVGFLVGELLVPHAPVPYLIDHSPCTLALSYRKTLTKHLLGVDPLDCAATYRATCLS